MCGPFRRRRHGGGLGSPPGAVCGRWRPFGALLRGHESARHSPMKSGAHRGRGASPPHERVPLVCPATSIPRPPCPLRGDHRAGDRRRPGPLPCAGNGTASAGRANTRTESVTGTAKSGRVLLCRRGPCWMAARAGSYTDPQGPDASAECAFSCSPPMTTATPFTRASPFAVEDDLASQKLDRATTS